METKQKHETYLISYHSVNNSSKILEIMEADIKTQDKPCLLYYFCSYNTTAKMIIHINELGM